MIGETSLNGVDGVPADIVSRVSITTIETQKSIVSNLTRNVSATPKPIFPVLSVLKSYHLEILLTPPSRMMNMPGEIYFRRDTTVICKDGLSTRHE